MQEDQPDEGKILSQIDRVAQARAELEKANARMLFDLRKQLTPDQWKQVQADRAARREAHGPEGAGPRWHPRGPGGGLGDHLTPGPRPPLVDKSDVVVLRARPEHRGDAGRRHVDSTVEHT